MHGLFLRKTASYQDRVIGNLVGNLMRKACQRCCCTDKRRSVEGSGHARKKYGEGHSDECVSLVMRFEHLRQAIRAREGKPDQSTIHEKQRNEQYYMLCTKSPNKFKYAESLEGPLARFAGSISLVFDPAVVFSGFRARAPL